MRDSREHKKNQYRKQMISGKADDEDYEQSYAREWKRRRKRRIIIALIIIAAAVILAVAAFLFLRFHRYQTCELTFEKELSEGSFVGYERYGNNALKYSHDGAAYIDIDGETVWVDSYDMQNPACYISGEYACIADIQGGVINIYNEAGKLGSAETILPVTKAVVSESGICAAIESDQDAAYIHFYDKSGEPIDISVKSLLSGDGYPVDLALSPSGTQLITSFAYLDGGQLRTKVVFYDFSEIGKNVPNRLVGGFEEPFTDSLAARVRFINSIYSYAVSDQGIYFFSSRNVSSPEMVKEIPAEEQTIESIFNCKDQVGVVYKNPPEAEAPYHLVMYSASGETELDFPIDFSFDRVSSDNTYIYFSDGDKCTIINRYGTVKFSGKTGDTAKLITNGKWPWVFVFSGANYIREYTFR